MAVLSKVANIAVQPQPVGVIEAFAGSNAPNGWLICDGSQVSRSLFPELFSVIGTTYGSGDGFSTFTLPDLRGRTIAGRDGVNNMNNGPTNRLTSTHFGASGTALGNSGGVESHTLTTAQLASHNHTQDAHSHNVTDSGGFTPSVSNIGPPGGGVGYYARNQPSGQILYTDSRTPGIQNTGGGNAHNNTQPTMILNYIIKAVSELPRGGWYNSSSPDLVTSLPTNPYNGQEVVLVQTVAGTTYHTAKRYDGATWKDIGAIPPSGWVVPSFLNSWTNYGGEWQTARYMKDANGTVFVEGLVANGTLGQPIFNLPAGYRPAATLIFPTLANQTIGRMDVQGNGNLYVSLSTAAFVSINCSFKASQ